MISNGLPYERELCLRGRKTTVACCGTTSGDNVLRDAHPKRSNEQDSAATENINSPESRECADDIDDVGDNLQDESAGQPSSVGA